MDFKTFLFSEEVALVKSLLDSNQIVHLGKIGWWQVYSALPTNTSLNRVISYQEYKQNNGRLYDSIVDSYNKIKISLENASWKLAKLGFPKMQSVLIFADLSNKTNRSRKPTEIWFEQLTT